MFKIVFVVILSIFLLSCGGESGGNSNPANDKEPPQWSTDNTLYFPYVDYNDVMIGWYEATDNVGVKEYYIYQDGIFIANVTENNYMVTNLEQGTIYQFRVEALDKAGNITTNGPIGTVKTLGNSNSETPTWGDNAEIRVLETGSSGVVLEWDEATDEDGVAGYKIFKDGTFIKDVVNTEATIYSLAPNSEYLIKVEAFDQAGNLSSDGPEITVQTSNQTVQNLSDIATEIDPTVGNNFVDNYSFIYQGLDSIQYDYQEGSIDPALVGIISGKVLDKDGLPISGVKVTIFRNEKYGYTYTRENGEFDIAVNGGDKFKIRFKKDGLIPVTKIVKSERYQFSTLNDIVMIPYSEKATTIDLNSGNLSIARGELESDSSGERQATVIISPDTKATIINQNGEEIELDQITLRITEFTVGDMGLNRMPGDLPSTTGYTYAAEFSIDEAIENGADSVKFDKPVNIYLENFINLPVGTKVPVGYYDRTVEKWITSKDGKVIKILDIVNNKAVIDFDGDDLEDNPLDYSESFTDSELEKIGELYEVGKTLWWVSIDHFTPCDLNLPFACEGTCTTDGSKINDGDGNKEGNDCLDGCVIDLMSQAILESVGIDGTDYSLVYRSDRTGGYLDNYKVKVDLKNIPSDVKKIYAELHVAGKVIKKDFEKGAIPEVTYLEWDGKDKVGRVIQGKSSGSVKIGYEYSGKYIQPSEQDNNFGVNPGTVTELVPSRESIILWRYKNVNLGHFDTRGINLGGWSLNIYHQYDLIQRVTTLGNGGEIDGNDLGLMIEKVVGCTGGICTEFNDGDETTNSISAISAKIHPQNICFMNGDLYFTETHYNDQTYLSGVRVLRGGNVDFVAGMTMASSSTSKCGIDNKYAGFYEISDMSCDNGKLLISEYGDCINHIYDKTYLIAGGSNQNIGSEINHGDRALDVTFTAITSILDTDEGIYVFNEGSLYSINNYFLPNSSTCNSDTNNGTQFSNRLIYKQIDRFNSTYTLNEPKGLTKYKGDLYFVDSGPDMSGKIYKYSEFNNSLECIGGCNSDQAGYPIDGLHIKDSPFMEPRDIVFDKDGGFYLLDYDRVIYVGEDGIIRTIAGLGGSNIDPNKKQSALYSALNNPTGIALKSDGTLYIAEQNMIRKLVSPYPSFSLEDIDILSEDGSSIYRFNRKGKHIKTFDRVSKNTIFEFIYEDQENYEGKLVSIKDYRLDPEEPLVTLIDGDDNGIDILSPYGDITEIKFNDDKFVESAKYNITSYEDQLGDDIGEISPIFKMEYSTELEGLLTKFERPGGDSNIFSYSDNGRFERDQYPDLNGVVPFKSVVSESSRYIKRYSNAAGEVGYYEKSYNSDGVYQFLKRDKLGYESLTLYNSDMKTTKIDKYPDGVKISETIIEYDETPLWIGSKRVKKRTKRLYDEVNPEIHYDIDFTSDIDVEYLDSDNLMDLSSIKTTDRINDTEITTNTEINIDKTKIITQKVDKNNQQFGKVKVTKVDNFDRVKDIYWVDSLENIETANPIIAPIKYSYNNEIGYRKLVKSTTQGEGENQRVIDFSYDNKGRLSTIKSYPDSETTLTKSFEYDSLDRVVKEILPDGNEINYKYDKNGNISVVKPAGKDDHKFLSNVWNLPYIYQTPEIDSEIFQTTKEYNNEQNIKKITRGDGDTLDYIYDEQYSDQINQILVTNGDNIEYGYDDRRRLNLIKKGDIEIGYDYSNTPLVSMVNLKLKDSIDYSLSVNSRYDDGKFFIDNVTIGDNIGDENRTINFTYDENDLLLSKGELIFGRDELYRINMVEFGDIVDHFTYNQFGEIDSYRSEVGENAIYSYQLGYNNIGKIISKTEIDGDNINNYQYEYDLRGRLVKVYLNEEEIESYIYDSNGNRLVGIVNGELFNGEYDSQDRLKSYGDMEFSYNKNGELITKQVGSDMFSMDYDVFGNLIQYRKNCDPDDECEQKIEYKYDPLGRKIGRIYQNGNITESERWYIYGDQLNPILELDKNGIILAQFVYGVNSNTPEYMIKDGKKYKIISDHLGSVRKVIDFDTKEVVQEIKYDSFGNILEDNNPDFQPFGYVGGLQDRETGYVNFGAREYDPKTGRWTSKEPLGFDGSMNFYGYCEGDPVNFVDVSGLKYLELYSTEDEAAKAAAQELYCLTKNHPHNVEYDTWIAKIPLWNLYFYYIPREGHTTYVMPGSPDDEEKGYVFVISYIHSHPNKKGGENFSDSGLKKDGRYSIYGDISSDIYMYILYDKIRFLNSYLVTGSGVVKKLNVKGISKYETYNLRTDKIKKKYISEIGNINKVCDECE